MKLRHTSRIALAALAAHKSRSSLTVLGMVIGIAAIMLIMSIGSGAERLIVAEISGFGAEIIVIRPGQEPKGPTDIAETIFSDSLKNRDIDALKRRGNVPGLVDIAPALIVPGSVSYLNETFRPTVLGWSAEFMSRMFGVFPETGVLFDENDIRQRASVAVIGAKVKNELFGDADAIGEFIKIKDRKFRVVGALPPRGQVAFFDMNELVIIPYTTAQTYLLGTSHFHEIMVRAESPEAVAATVRDIEATLRENHGITDPAKDDFFVVTQQGLVSQIQTILRALTVFLAAVVAIALVVGGIGVMNIMLVSVTERTKEIGLRKAIGASEKNILAQFLLEAVYLTALGGVLGILCGALLSFLASIVLTRFADLNWAFTFPLQAVFLGLGVSTLVGLVFGIYPAREAARKNPIDALRYE